MSADATKDFAAWLPHLVQAYRSRLEKKGGPPARGAFRGGGGRHHQHRQPPPLAPSNELSPHDIKLLAGHVKQLSMGLTRDRHLAGASYMDDPHLLGAYLLFYWPVSYAQARAVLGELNRPLGSVLDLGAGPGPMTFAALDAGARDALAADRSKPALELARSLAILAQESLGTREWSPGAPLPEGKFDVIMMGHVVNELFKGDVTARANLLEKIAAQLKANGSLVIIEPALRETSRALLEVRDLLVARGFSVRAPCLFRGPCPALIKPSDWCHAERQWHLPPIVERIAKQAGLHKDALKMSYLVLAPPGEAWAEPPPGRLFRIVSEPLEGKGRQRYMGCGPEGRIGLAMQERHRNDATKAFFSLKRGDVVRVDGGEPKGDGLALTDTSTIEVIAPAGQSIWRYR